MEVVRPSEKRGTNMWTSPAESRDRAKRRPREDLPITGSLLKISVAAALVLSLQIMAVAAGRQRNGELDDFKPLAFYDTCGFVWRYLPTAARFQWRN